MTNNNIKETQPLKWAFDISAYRLIGRELITDKITAVYELVKNSYDANARRVDIIFEHNEQNECQRIIINDNGLGMSEKDIREKWMVIGSNSKRQSRISPPPLSRKMVGKKGIGRFAIDKLGAYVKMQTKRSREDTLNNVVIDWRLYEAEEKSQLQRRSESIIRPSGDSENSTEPAKLFTDIENTFWLEADNSDLSGTKLIIEQIRDKWDFEDIELLISELSKLASPFSEVESTFKMHVTALRHGYKEKLIESKAVGYASHEFRIGFHPEKQIQESLRYDESTNSLKKDYGDYLSFGPVEIVVFYFDKVAKSRFKKNTDNQLIDGIKIYRDGLITTPFAESVTSTSQKKDILGLDKRRWSGFFNKISSRDILGYIEMSDELNPEIIESTNRQGFIINKEFKELCEFFFNQISAIEEFLQGQKEARRIETESDLKMAKEEIIYVGELLTELKKIAPIEVKSDISNITKNIKKLGKRIDRGISEYREIEIEKTRQENLFFSLMSLQEYAGEIAHMVRTSIAKISRFAQFFYEEFPNPKYNNLYGKYAKSIFEEMNSLSRALDFMLSYTKTNIGFEKMNIQQMLDDLIYIAYIEELEKNNIEVQIDIDQGIEVFHNRKFFEDIFQNLIDNSIKALSKSEQSIKKIIIKGRVSNDQIVFKIADNGPGIPDKIKSRVFNVFFTTTENQGGGGIGLFSVKKRIQAMNGSIKVIDNPYFAKGAAFELILPFKK